MSRARSDNEPSEISAREGSVDNEARQITDVANATSLSQSTPRYRSDLTDHRRWQRRPREGEGEIIELAEDPIAVAAEDGLVEFAELVTGAMRAIVREPDIIAARAMHPRAKPAGMNVRFDQRLRPTSRPVALRWRQLRPGQSERPSAALSERPSAEEA